MNTELPLRALNPYRLRVDGRQSSLVSRDKQEFHEFGKAKVYLLLAAASAARGAHQSEDLPLLGRIQSHLEGTLVKRQEVTTGLLNQVVFIKLGNLRLVGIVIFTTAENKNVSPFSEPGDTEAVEARRLCFWMYSTVQGLTTMLKRVKGIHCSWPGEGVYSRVVF